MATPETHGAARMPGAESFARASTAMLGLPPKQGHTAAFPQNHRLPLTHRIACGAMLGGIWAVGYFGIAWRIAPVADPTTALDTAIPFIGWTVWIYLAGLAWIIAPLALVREPRLFRRAAFAYAIAIGAGFLCFTALQTEAPALRAQAVPDGLGTATAWALLTLHRTDAPVNLLPSLHVALAWLAAWALGRQHRPWRHACHVTAVAITASVCLVKQHTVLDAVAGLLLAWLCARLATAGRRDAIA
ncbi:phosphatase PAP2 family protein [Ralstonia pseudosolanacearum]